MMIFQQDMPRSLAVCTRWLHRILEMLADNPRTEAVRQAGALAARLRYGRMEDVLEQGMKPFLDDFMQRLDALGQAIVDQFMTSIDTDTRADDRLTGTTGAMLS
jgi:uncharacterized alpha-E superfamily protein